MLTTLSFAKINLFLHVLSKRADSFHNVYTLFSKISLRDYISVKLNKTFVLECNDPNISTDEDNTLSKVYNILKTKYNIKGVFAYLYKNIPSGAGLGGGSSNCATFLEILNNMNNLNLKLQDKIEILSQVSSDAPFFLYHGPKIGLEKGNIIVDAPALPFFYLILVKPDISIATADIYKNFTLTLTGNFKSTKIEKYISYNNLITLMHNDLEDTIFMLYPQIKELKQMLLHVGADKSLVTGSGSAVYGIFSSLYKANKAYLYIKKYYSHLSVYRLMRID